MLTKLRKLGYNQFENLSSNTDKLYYFITYMLVTNKSKNIKPKITCNNNYNTDHYLYFFTLSLSVISTLLLFSMIFISNAVAFDPHATTYKFIKKWGSKGTGDGQFQRVHDLDFDPTEKYLYTVDRDGNRIQVFDKNGNFIKKWGSKGTGDGEFTVPYSVDVDSKGDVWVADRGNHRIQKFDKDGNFITKFGSVGKGNGQFTNPEHLAVDSAGNVYVSDRKANTIQVFKPIA